MRPILRKPAAVGRLFGALVLALGLANAMPLGARAADITLTQTVNGLANTILNTSLNGCSTGCGGGGGCSGFAYTVGAITNPTPVQGEGNVLANGHEYAASVTLNNVGCTWDLNHVVLAAQAAPSNWWDSRSGTAWRNSGQVAVSGGGAVGQFSSVTFKFNLLPNGDVQPGAAGSGPVNQQVLFSLYDTSTGATATCEGGCSGGYIALTARMGNFHARLDTTGSALATNAPIVVQQGGDTSITLVAHGQHQPRGHRCAAVCMGSAEHDGLQRVLRRQHLATIGGARLLSRCRVPHAEGGALLVERRSGSVFR